MRKTLLTLALTASAIAAAACGAQTAPAPSQSPMATTDMPRGPGPHRGGGMMRADADGDGVVTRAEAIAEADQRFDRMDTNRDGRVTPDEMAALRTAMRDRLTAAGRTPPPDGDAPTRMGRRQDPDGDGVMTKADAEALAAKRFDRMDANHDGRLDRTELANVSEMRRVRHREMQDTTPPPPPPATPPGE